MLWFNFILHLIFIFFCFELVIIHYHTKKQKKIKIKQRRKLNHNIYIVGNHILYYCRKQQIQNLQDEIWLNNHHKFMKKSLFYYF